MNGDFTRFPIGYVADSLYPLAQQGRVHLDSDWNELAATLTDTVRLGIDALLGGSAAVDRGFRPDGPPDETLSFGKGTYFVDGYRIVAPASVRLGEQPFQPRGDVTLPAPAAAATNLLFYLDAWIRHVTARTRPDLIEAALRGPDTTTRGILTWQVRATRVPEQTATELRRNWSTVVERIRPRDRATLRAWLEVADPQEPCLDDAASGYTGPNNQLYRFEVVPAPPGDGVGADAKVLAWSRENASFESRIRSGAGASVESISDPTAPALLPGAIVQLVDDAVELGDSSNSPVRITSADPDEDHVTVDGPAIDLDESDAASGHARLRHWDGILELVDGEQGIEHGLRIDLRAAADAVVGDYWVVPARTNGTLLWPDDRRWPQRDWPDDFRPPHGVDHMYAPLALVVGETVMDARWTVASMRDDYVSSRLPKVDSPGQNKWENTSEGIRKVPEDGSLSADGRMNVILPDGLILEEIRITGSITGPFQQGSLTYRLVRVTTAGDREDQIASGQVSTAGEFDLSAPADPQHAVVDTAGFQYSVLFKVQASVGDKIAVNRVRIGYRRD